MEHPVYEEECFKIRFKNRRIKYEEDEDLVFMYDTMKDENKIKLM